tara:strand:- start:6582 stop:7730 length:1149 start_codon:yes stop_codon:yes gene_type:complete
MAISSEKLYNELINHGINFFTGVPDSLLKNFCGYIEDNVKKTSHIIAANEGNAIAIASGHYLATNKIPLVYMQNSGLGNAINPLLSLCDPDVYSIPMIILIGWRGEPGVKDEPQHVKQGKVQKELLDTLDIPYECISKDEKNINEKISKCVSLARKESRPVAILARKGTFEKYIIKNKNNSNNIMSREDALNVIIENINQKSIMVSTTGKTSREIFEIREKRRESHSKDFLTVGSMGHCSSIALGIALSRPEQEVVCIDGDGSLLMHLGSITALVDFKPKNLKYILINNNVHESVGGQRTVASELNIFNIISSISKNDCFQASTIDDLKTLLPKFMAKKQLSFLEVNVYPGSRDDLGRPTIKPIENKINLMNAIEKNAEKSL